MPTTITHPRLRQREKALAKFEAWIAAIVEEIGSDDMQAVLELPMIRHRDEMRADGAISDLLVQTGFEETAKPYLDQGLSEEAAADAAWRDLKRGAEKNRGRQHKHH